MRTLSAFFSFFLLFSFSIAFSADGYRIQVKVKGVKKDSLCFLANYYGDKQYIQDTAKVNEKGEFTFEGTQTLAGGIYLIVLHNKKYFETILDKEQFFSLETDTADFIQKMKIKGNDENKSFYNYLQMVTPMQKEGAEIQKKLATTKNKDSTALLQKKLQDMDKKQKDFKKDFIQKYPKLFLSNIFRAMDDPEVPEAPTLPNGRKDSTFAFKYYRAHYFDNIDFSDERLIRTPLYHPRLKYFLEKLTLQHPDSISAAADIVVQKAKASKELFKYTVYYITSTYELSKIMGFEAVFVHMAKKYYATKQAFWVDSAQNKKIVDRATQMEFSLIGRPCPYMKLVDTNDFPRPLYDIKAKYTVLFIWDYDCGHCKKIAPKLAEAYKKDLKDKGVQVYAMQTETDREKWKKTIHELGLNDFLHVYDPKKESYFKYYFDIYSTPVVYILDENKKIIAKRIEVDQINEIITRKQKEKKN